MRIVLATLGSFGDLYPLLAIAQALRARGHTPVIAAPASYGPRVAALGLDFHPLRPDFSPEVLMEIFGDPVHGGRRLYHDTVFPQTRATFDDLLAATEGADALVVGELVYVAPLVAARRGLPWASVMLAPSTMMSALDPSVLTWFPAGYHLRHLGAWPQRLMFRVIRRQVTRWGAPLLALQREMGVGTGDIVFTDKFSPHLVLVLFPPAFGAPQRDWPAASVQTGFPFFTQEADPETAARIASFLAAGPPPVVFTLGTTVVHLAHDFYKVAAETALALGRRAILLMGNNPRPDAPADKVLALDYAPHSSLFPHAAAVVQHGGVGGCAEALRAGVPVLTIPFAFDQPDNAMRMRRLGVGAVLPRTSVNRDTLERSLRAVLEDPAFAARARAVAREIDPDRDMARTVAAIEALAAVPARGG
ncbi:glycosyltransferase [Ancylobacter lacus]|uniref:glycosyltransferase n=1 Tax=Ancylobacter lacus TaxID=2579970 RepID=UPI001FEB3BF7|nr:glycosyltransferase [Ancylobacter lacus]